ncbi:hypothetical protein GTO91_15760 [Heliobacterium undosum]|uniref:Uncharacterized protein n=1 Tax=Heliomicrobium undosum TaxID=121734 RepID=A0A845L4E4_9FIRM|nr:CpsD/CapB family tyrosine-protein kinase [Heliomicrobium undosum]MZP31163.1 hypothetical protein [Heliomicrobium undosum]
MLQWVGSEKESAAPRRVGLAVPWLEEFMSVFPSVPVSWTAGSQALLMKVLSGERDVEPVDILMLSSRLSGPWSPGELFDRVRPVKAAKRIAVLERGEEGLEKKLNHNGWAIIVNGRTPMEEASRLLGVECAKQSGIFVSVFSPSGTHTSVLAIEIAQRLQQSGYPTLLVDGGSTAEITRRMNWSQETGLASLLPLYEAGREVEEADIRRAVCRWSGGEFISGYAQLSELGRMSEDFASAFFRKVRCMYPAVVVDTSPVGILPMTFASLQAATHIIMPYKAAWADRLNRDHFSEIAQVNADTDQTVIPVAVNTDRVEPTHGTVNIDMRRLDEAPERWSPFGEELISRIAGQQEGGKGDTGIAPGKGARRFLAVLRSI